jgi:PST family polysaccharide transporter
LIVFLGLDGALIALVTNQSVIFFIVLWMLRKNQVIKLENFKSSFDSAEGKKLASFALMTMFTLISVPLSLILVRNFISDAQGLNQAGYWQAVWHLSSMYLLIFMTVIKIYFLPKLSEIENKKQLRYEIIQGLSLFLFTSTLGFTLIYTLKESIVILLFSKEFLPMADLFFWQLLGDFFKLAGTFFGILLAAKAKNFRVILINVFFSVLFVLLAHFYLEKMGLEGVVYAHFVNNAIFLVFVFFVAWDLLYEKSSNNNINL